MVLLCSWPSLPSWLACSSPMLPQNILLTVPLPSQTVPLAELSSTTPGPKLHIRPRGSGSRGGPPPALSPAQAALRCGLRSSSFLFGLRIEGFGFESWV